MATAFKFELVTPERVLISADPEIGSREVAIFQKRLS